GCPARPRATITPAMPCPPHPAPWGAGRSAGHFAASTLAARASRCAPSRSSKWTAKRSRARRSICSGWRSPNQASESQANASRRDRMADFWLSCGHHLLDRDDGGGLLVTDEFLKAYLARPDLAPPPKACAAERGLHAPRLED